MSNPAVNPAESLMKEMLSGCTSCGECVRVCRFLQQHGAPAVIAGSGTAKDNLLKAFDCSLCGLCDAVCPVMLSPSAMFLSMRQEAFSQGIVDLKPYLPWINYEKTGASFLFRRDFIPQGCKTIFFPGCSLSGSRPDAVLALFNSVRQKEPSAGMVLDCCGKISRDLGLVEQFKTIFARLSDRLRSKGVSCILSSCPGCSKVLNENAEGFDVKSIYELLASDSGWQKSRIDLQGNQSASATVVIHDPCMTRFDPVQQKAVRQLVLSCGYQIEELPSSGVVARCCGQGGMVEGSVPGTVRQESGKIANEAAGRPLITSCGACCNTLSEVTMTAHVADLLTGRPVFSAKKASSARRWLNRFRLRCTRLDYASNAVSGKKIALILAVAVTVGLFFYLDLGRYLTLESLKANRQLLLEYYADHQALTIAAFIAIYIIQTCLALPGAVILSLSAGAVFGTLAGTFFAVTSATIGATLSFLVTRYLLREMIISRFGNKLEGINRELEQRGINYLLFLRLVPVFPFFLINLGSGLTRLPLRTFVLGTFFGIIPGGFVFVNAGASLASISALSDIASPRVLGSFALLGLFALIPALYSKFKNRAANQ